MIQPVLSERLQRLGHNWGWFLAVGVSYVVLGIAAFSWPVASTVGMTYALGLLFIASGIIHIVQSIRLRKESGNGWRVFQSIVALAAGVLMLRYPASGMLGIAIAMAFYFFVSSGVKGASALAMRPLRGWGWNMVGSIASLLLGIYVVATFPVSALWMPGFLLGVDFVIYGSSVIGFSFSLRRFHHEIEIARKVSEHPEHKKAA